LQHICGIAAIHDRESFHNRAHRNLED
jgi:hypothetical protein